MTGYRKPVALGAVFLLSLGLAGCVGESESAPPTDSPPQAPAPSPTPTQASPTITSAPYEPPPESDEGQVGRATILPVTSADDVPTTEVLAGPESLDGASEVEVLGACVGDSFSFDVLSTTNDTAGDVIASGRISCDEGVNVVPIDTGDYVGAVQLSPTNTDGVSEGGSRPCWLTDRYRAAMSLR